MNVALMLAAGTGSRVGALVPKQFIEVLGKPILAYSLENFQNHSKIDAIQIVYHKDWLEETTQIVEKYNISKVKWLTEGGNTFQESVINGLEELKKHLAPEDVVVLGLANYPMLTKDIIEDSLHICKLYGNAIAGEDIYLCTCIKDDEISSTQGILRETIKGLAIPQTYNFGELCDVYETANKRGLIESTDPHVTSLYQVLGKRLYFSKSASTNLKITTKEDIELFEALLVLREKKTKEEKNNDNI